MLAVGVLIIFLIPNYSFIGYTTVIIDIIAFIAYAASNSSEEKYEQAMRQYEEELKIYNSSMYEIQMMDPNIKSLEDKNNYRNNQIKSATDSINEDIDVVQETLERAYSLNIIPMPFRNIEGVYYLYDYISSSNQSLSEALMQANLEQIKNKMDDVIKLQAVNIIQQSQANAKLDNIQSQNEQIIKNTEISAINSEITKKILKRDLAYQRADFWLK